jgi:hypothetical protein
MPAMLWDCHHTACPVLALLPVCYCLLMPAMSWFFHGTANTCPKSDPTATMVPLIPALSWYCHGTANAYPVLPWYRYCHVSITVYPASWYFHGTADACHFLVQPWYC